MVAALSGSFADSDVEELVRRFSAMPASMPERPNASAYHPCLTLRKKATEQNQLVLGFPGLETVSYTHLPADGRLLESASLKIEEAALTGESVPVTKFIDILDPGSAPDVPLGDRKNMMYMGSTVVYGRGTAVVTATGKMCIRDSPHTYLSLPG